MSVAAQMSEKISGTPPKVIVAFHSGQCEWGYVGSNFPYQRLDA